MAKDIETLNKDIETNVRQANEITEKAEADAREITDEESLAIDALLATVEGLKGELKAAEEKAAKNQERKDKIAAAVKEINAPRVRISNGQIPNADPDKPNVRVKGYHALYGSLKAFDNVESAYRCGHYFRALAGSHSSKMWCRNHGLNIYAANSEGSDSLGGVLVPPEFTGNIIILRENYGVFRKECKVIPMARDVYEWPRRVNGVTVYWAGENGALTESDATFDMVQLVAQKLTALSLMSVELEDDALVNMADYIIDEFAYGFSKEEDAAGFNGDGTSAHGGFTGVVTKFNNNYSTAPLQGAYAAASGHHTFGTFDNTDLTGFMGTLPQYAHDGAKFYCSQTFHDVVFQRLAAVAGGNTIQTLSGEFKPAYLGHEIVISQQLPMGANTNYSNTAVCLFGRLDMACAMGERKGIEARRSDDRYFELDQVGLKATERVCFNAHDVGTLASASTPLAGPVVALMGTT
jgi:HK97 family phage major capsid protein